MAAHIMLTGITLNVCPQISKGYSAPSSNPTWGAKFTFSLSEAVFHSFTSSTHPSCSLSISSASWRKRAISKNWRTFPHQSYHLSSHQPFFLLECMVHPVPIRSLISPLAYSIPYTPTYQLKVFALKLFSPTPVWSVFPNFLDHSHSAFNSTTKLPSWYVKSVF